MYGFAVVTLVTIASLTACAVCLLLTSHKGGTCAGDCGRGFRKGWEGQAVHLRKVLFGLRWGGR